MMKDKTLPDYEGMKRGITARSPHMYRTFSAPLPLIECGTCAVHMRKMCGNRGEYLPVIPK